MKTAAIARNETELPPEGFFVQASTVTASQDMPVQVGGDSSVRVVTQTIADLMHLPADVGWALRDDGSSQYLDDDRAIGDQVRPGARVSITPRTHLGG